MGLPVTIYRSESSSEQSRAALGPAAAAHAWPSCQGWGLGITVSKAQCPGLLGRQAKEQRGPSSEQVAKGLGCCWGHRLGATLSGLGATQSDLHPEPSAQDQNAAHPQPCCSQEHLRGLVLTRDPHDVRLDMSSGS